jgi:hypothetical protein
MLTVALLLCLSPMMPQAHANTFAKVAHARGYDVQIGHSPACAVDVIRADETLVYDTLLTYRGPMTADLAHDLLISWEARIPEAK